MNILMFTRSEHWCGVGVSYADEEPAIEYKELQHGWQRAIDACHLPGLQRHAQLPIAARILMQKCDAIAESKEMKSKNEDGHDG